MGNSGSQSSSCCQWHLVSYLSSLSVCCESPCPHLRIHINNIPSLAIYINRGDGRPKKKGASDERLKKLDAVSPICRLDQWWPNVKGSLGLPEAADNQFIWYVVAWRSFWPLLFCHLSDQLLIATDSVVCLEPVLNSQEIHQLNCMHVFHKECLEKWYLGDHFNCPLCHRAYFHEARRPTNDFVWMV